MVSPTRTSQRIESLDVLRGFALLGILLLNILGFGMVSSAYMNPMVGEDAGATANLATWATVDLLFEGAMRGLFSILFGAGVALFTDAARGKTAALHYKRNFWLLVFGVVDAFVFLWTGDILITYALAGFLLYPARNASAKRLLIMAGVVFVLTSATYAGTHFGMSQAFGAAIELRGNPDAGEDIRALAAAWDDFNGDFEQTEAETAAELEARRASYLSAAEWTRGELGPMLLFVLPVIMFWDALLMMLIGMALYKLHILDGSRSDSFYLRLMLIGFAVGLSVNGYEAYHAASNEFFALATFPYAQWTYHIGRGGMAAGYIGLVMLACRRGWWAGLRTRLAAVGRMALTNYLMHSLIALFVFTGAGLALVGELQRWQLYLVVGGIWVLQLIVSPWWLKRHDFGPVERLWRWLTYRTGA